MRNINKIIQVYLSREVNCHISHPTFDMGSYVSLSRTTQEDDLCIQSIHQHVRQFRVVISFPVPVLPVTAWTYSNDILCSSRCFREKKMLPLIFAHPAPKHLGTPVITYGASCNSGIHHGICTMFLMICIFWNPFRQKQPKTFAVVSNFLFCPQQKKKQAHLDRTLHRVHRIQVDDRPEFYPPQIKDEFAYTPGMNFTCPEFSDGK